MKLLIIFVILKIGSSLETFFDEMTKFKAGLNERPQTYRKIEVSSVSGLCSDECPNRIWFEIAEEYVEK